MADKQARKWQLTINNPQDKGLDHDAIKKALEQFKSCVYWCMADEVGLDTHTPHTHLFFCLKTPGKFSTVKKRFPDAHIEAAHGTVQEVVRGRKVRYEHPRHVRGERRATGGAGPGSPN